MKKKILASILAAVTMVTCAFSAVACNQNVPQEDEVSSSVQEEAKDSGNLAVEDVTPTPGMRLNVKRLSNSYTGENPDVGIMPAAVKDSYQLTATVLPADAADKTVTYSVAWKNASSAWANAKTVTDYVTVTQTSTGSLMATATCKQAFGEPIVVTVTSNSNPEAKATATLHYKQKIEKIQLLEGSGYIDFLCDVTEYGNANEEQLSGFLNVDFNADLGGAQLYPYIVGGSVYTRENQDVGNVGSVHITPTVDFCAVLASLGFPFV